MLSFLLPGFSILTFLLIVFLSKKLAGKPLIGFNQRFLTLLTRNSRRTVFLIAFLTFVVLLFSSAYLAETATRFGKVALALLLFVYVPGLSIAYFPSFRLNGLLVKSRRAIGVSAFFYALAHYILTVYSRYGGRLDYFLIVPERELLPVFLGTSAFLLLIPVLLTSFDRAVAKLNFRRWKLLHRLVYPITILVVFHAFFIGSSFSNPFSLTPLLVNYSALTILLLKNWDFIKKAGQLSNSYLKYFSIITLLVIALLGMLLSFYALSA